ncbi:hypothetical protein DLP3_094 [Stenotrophomonas phage vB_SmaS_DLP_3]|nr:hypothetical protein DLP3_094 [Stenotrophomonas phage vB_SmaS_DLP_3]
MQLSLFQNAFLKRNADGYGYHKDLPKPLTHEDDTKSVEFQLAELGYEVAYVTKGAPKADKNEKAEAEKNGEYHSPNVADWNPEAPSLTAKTGKQNETEGVNKKLTAEANAAQLKAVKGGDDAKGFPRDSESKDLLSNDPWHLVAVYDTENKGPTAMFARKKVQKADTPEEAERIAKERAERTKVTPDDRIDGNLGVIE